VDFSPFNKSWVLYFGSIDESGAREKLPATEIFRLDGSHIDRPRYGGKDNVGTAKEGSRTRALTLGATRVNLLLP
jgi:hypothetical protein